MQVLIVEDDHKTSEWLRLYLEREGLTVRSAFDCGTALQVFDQQRPDLILLDVMLPGGSGIDLCRAVRASASTPIIMITARAAEEDRLQGFDAGADDYITKPFSPREVVARVRAVLRRTGAGDAAAPVAVGPVVLDVDAGVVRSASAQQKVTAAEGRLLAVLMRHPGRTWTRTQLLEKVFGEDHDSTDRTIDVHVKNLRRKMDALALGPGGPAIETAFGVGYRFVEHAGE